MSIWEKLLNNNEPAPAPVPEMDFDFSRFKKSQAQSTSEKVFVFGRSPSALNENFSSIFWTPKKSVIIESVYCYTTMDDVPLSNFFLINEAGSDNILFQPPDSQSIVPQVGSGLLSVLRMGFNVDSDVKKVKIILVGGVQYLLLVEANQLAAPAVSFRGFCYIGYKEVDL